MLPKINRLARKKDFERVFREGKNFKEDFLVLKIVKGHHPPTARQKMTRFGIIVSQKISKKATLRNKIKRRIGEIIRLKIKKIKKGADIIIIAIPGLETKDFWEIEETLNKLFLKAKIINE